MWIRASVLLAVTVSALSVAEPRAGCLELKRTARFTVYFDKVDLEKLVQTVSDATCLSFLVSDGVKGRISIVGPENGKLQLDADAFYAAFLAALDANGLAAVPQGRFVRIVEKRSARQFPVPLFTAAEDVAAGDGLVTKLYRIKHVEFDVARAGVAAFSSAGGDVVPLAPDLLIVTDLASNQGRIARLLSELDVPRAPTDVVRLVRVHHATVTELVELLSRALTSRAPGKPGDAVVALADERTNRVLLAGAPGAVDRAEALVTQLDVEVPGDARARVVKLKNADAKELAGTLEAMAGSTSARRAPGAPPAPGAGATTGEVRISVNEALNALLIVSSGSDYRALLDVIEQLDRPVRQVFIETVIMEVNVQRDTKVGVSAHGVGGNTTTGVVYGSQPEGAPSSLSLASLASSSGFLFGLGGSALSQVASALGLRIPAVGLTVQASQSTSDVNVLSMPHILTADNKEAEITVGQRIPFQLGVNQAQLAQLLAAGNTTGANLTNLTGTISREKVELKLTVKPHIGDDGAIRLDINQQAEELAGTSSSAGPITSTRGQKASVVAKDDETLVLGGIMQDREIEQVSKVPLLGDVPVLGVLFRNTTKTRTKVNLLVFLTPHVIDGPADVKRLMEKKLAERTRVLEQVSRSRLETEGQALDLDARPGPLAAIARALSQAEQAIIEPR
ncbi:MAG: type II secretion system secretin GspD [Myxococcaceae bacterium]|nr:type II secretion system secretin GspD [Myxococcaceae bacterium]